MDFGFWILYVFFPQIMATAPFRHFFRCYSSIAAKYPTPDKRLSQFRMLLENQRKKGEVVRILEAHSGLSALIAEAARGPQGEAFHAVWSSSLTSSAINLGAQTLMPLKSRESSSCSRSLYPRCCFHSLFSFHWGTHRCDG